MPIALGLLLACLLALALASTLEKQRQAIENFLTFSLPLIGRVTIVGKAVANTLAHVSKLMYDALDGYVVEAETWVRRHLLLVLSLPMTPAVGTYEALKYLWHEAMPQRIDAQTQDLRGSLAQPNGSVVQVYRDVYSSSSPLPAKLTTALASARSLAASDAITWTRQQDYATNDHVHGVYQEIERDITTAKNAAQDYADHAVSDLKAAEDKAIRAAKSLAQTALDTAAADLITAENYADAAVKTARDALTAAINTAEQNALTAAAGALTTAEQEIGAVQAAAADALAAARTDLSNAISAAETEAVTQAHQLVSDASAAAASALHDAVTQAHQLVSDASAAAASALHDAVTQAQTALDTLRGAEDQAVRDARTAAADALAAARTTIADQLTAAGNATAAVAAEVASIATGAAGEIAGLPGLDFGGIDKLLRETDLTRIGEIGAGVVLTGALVHALAAETGLENAECRGKVKQICGTDPSAWGDLLGGLAALGFAFSLRELHQVAQPLVSTLEPIIREAA